MLRWTMLAGLLLAFAGTDASAQEIPGQIRREGGASFPIANSVELPPGSRIVYVSGTVPDVADPAAARGSPRRYGDTAAQTRSVLRTIEARLKAHSMTLGDVVMMRVFLVRPPGTQAMDFAGMMTAYREFFGTAAQPNRPARSTMEVAGLVDPGWLVEIEVTAARAPTRGRHQ
jgi:enamine deaminase RidA (YjgF/YER057c/UK114 family)